MIVIDILAGSLMCKRASVNTTDARAQQLGAYKPTRQEARAFDRNSQDFDQMHYKEWCGNLHRCSSDAQARGS